MIPFDVGTKVRILSGYFGDYNGREAVVTEGGGKTRMVASDPSLEPHTESLGGEDFHYCFYVDELEEVKVKVYILMAFDAEPYSHGSWIHGVYDSKEKAVAAKGDRYAVYGADEDGYGGYMISDRIVEKSVQ